MTSPRIEKQDLIDYFASGCKPRTSWRIGTEHEKFLLMSDSLKRFSYEGPTSIQTVLEALQAFNWEPLFENNNLISLKKTDKNFFITLEPGGQFELSGFPVETLHETKIELDEHLREVESILSSMGGVMVPLGTDPLWTRNDIPWMPKDRYQIMRKYMPTKGNLGLDMMTRTCTVQVNLDFESENDMATKMQIGMALQPLVTALFACSPFLDGKKTGYQSYRAHIWQDTDPDRCGLLPFVFKDTMTFERYVEYLLDVPMYFVYRDGRYIDARGQSFHDFLKGQLPALPGQYPTIKDWMDQTTIVFPEVRLKRFLEMRGADCGPEEMLMALPAFWVGLLYDSKAQDETLQLIKSWSFEQMLTTYQQTPEQGLRTLLGNRTLQTIARDVLAISEQGLKRRAKLRTNQDESIYLTPLWEIVESGRTVATKMIETYEKTGDIEAIVRQYAYRPL